MELKDRIAAVRKAAGLTQEQLGELLGVTRQAVSKWESGQTTPDAATIAALCEKLHVSADYVLLGKEPGEGQTAAYEPPDTCPCCGRKVSGSICPECGYQLPNHPPRGPQYAVVATRPGFVQSTESSAQLVKYCGFTQEDANNAIAHYVNNQSRILLRRGLVDSAAQYIAAHLDQDFFCPQIVVDCGSSRSSDDGPVLSAAVRRLRRGHRRAVSPEPLSFGPPDQLPPAGLARGGLPGRRLDAVPAERSAVSHPPAAGGAGPACLAFPAGLRPFLGSAHASVPAPIRGRPPGCPGGVAGGRGSAVPLAGVGPAGAWKLNMSKRPRRE